MGFVEAVPPLATPDKQYRGIMPEASAADTADTAHAIPDTLLPRQPRTVDFVGECVRIAQFYPSVSVLTQPYLLI